MIALFDKNHGQLFPDAQIVKMRVIENAKMMQHPVESGTVITDYKVVMPAQIILTIYLVRGAYRNTFAMIHRAYLKSTEMSLQDRAHYYSKLVISEMPHEESAEVFDGIILTLHLTEVLTVKPKSVTITKARKAKHTPTKSRGSIQPKKSSLLLQAFNKAKGYF